MRFEAEAPADSARASEATLYLCSALATACAWNEGYRTSTLVTATTGADGRAAALVAMGTVAGPTGVVISAPASALVDTARYIVQPGQPFRVRFLIRDTVAFVGVPLRPLAVVTDRFGNELGGTPALSPADTAAVSVAGQALLGRTVGRTAVEGIFPGTRPDTLRLLLVPHDMLAAVLNGVTLVTMGLDGSRLQRVADSVSYMAWSPASDSTLVFTRLAIGPDFPQIGHLMLWKSGSPPHALVVDAGTTISEAYPSISPDGQWIYFSGEPASFHWATYRIHMDGSGEERVAGNDSMTVEEAAASPDGTTLVAVTGPDDLISVDLATGTITQLPAMGEMLRWSPDGRRIAYSAESEPMQPSYPALIVVMNADGADRRFVPVNGCLGWYFDWTSDPDWIVDANYCHSDLELVRISDGLEIPLPYSLHMSGPNVRR